MCDKCKTFGGRKYYCPEYGEYEDYFKYCPYCGALLSWNEPVDSNDYWDWLSTLGKYTDEWRIALKVGEDYCSRGCRLNDYLDEIKEKVKSLL